MKNIDENQNPPAVQSGSFIKTGRADGSFAPVSSIPNRKGFDEPDGVFLKTTNFRPLVSAIVSTYNSSEFIRGCLQDLVDQTLFQKGLLEIVVVDSGSQQNEGEIVREFQSRYSHIQYIRTEKRETIYAAWNRGIRASGGTYLTSANTDDRHAPEMLETLALLLEAHPDKAAVYSHFYVTEIPNQTWQNKTPVRLSQWHPPYSRQALLKANFMGPQPMWRRSLHEEYGYFDGTLKVSGDWEFFLRISQTHSLLLNQQPMGLYYYNPSSLERSAGTREAEDLWLRQLYGRSGCRIIRRPFDPQVDEAFPGTPSAGQGTPRSMEIAIGFFRKAHASFAEGNMVSASRLIEQYQQTRNYDQIPVSRWERPGRGQPLLSVIIVTYERDSELKALLEALQRQDFQDFEVVIVDNGCSVRHGWEGWADVYVDCPINFHLSEGRNIGAYFARGRIAVFIDDDALVEPDYLSSIVRAYQTYEIAALRGRALPKSQSQKAESEFVYDLGKQPFACLCSQEGNSAFRLDCYRAAGGMDPLLFGHEGSDLAYRLIHRYGPASVLYWPQALIYHDYGDPEKFEKKQNQYRRNGLYLEYKHDFNIFSIKDSLSKVPLRRKGEGFVAGFSGLPPMPAPLRINRPEGNPRVSVLMACHNAEMYVRECMDSLLMQTLKEWELIAVDDGSTDGTRDLLRQYAQQDSRIRVFSFNEQKGPYLCRNFAIQQARAGLISIQDADDIAAPQKLGMLCDEIQRDCRLGIVGSFYRRFLEDFTLPECGDPMEKKVCHDAIMEAFSRSWHVCWHGSAVIRKSLFEKIGMYDSQPWGSDTFWLSKVGLYTQLTGSIRLKNIPEFLTFKREHSGSQTGRISPVNPLGRRKRLELYYLQKLMQIREHVQKNPALDAGALIRACTCSDFMPRYESSFSAWESRPLTEAAKQKILQRAFQQFLCGHFVSCLISLDYLASAESEWYSRCKTVDLIGGLCWFAVGQDEKAKKHLRQEWTRHRTSKAEEFLQSLDLGDLDHLTIPQRKEAAVLWIFDKKTFDELAQKKSPATLETTMGFPTAPKIEPILSVYMAAYNAEATIVRAMRSVLDQTWKEYELIVVDDGSMDRTVQIVRSFDDSRIRLVRQEHKNFAAGMNQAIRLARGEFVIGIDADDYVDSDYLERILCFARQNPDYDYYYPEKLILVDPQGKRTGEVWEYETFEDPRLLVAILFANGFSLIPNSSSLKRKSMFERTGLYQELENVEDFDFLSRNVLKIRFKKVIGSANYYYRRLPQSNTSRFEQRCRITAECLERMIHTYPEAVLCPMLSTITNPAERKSKFLDYVIAVFEKQARIFQDQSGRIYEQLVQKYRRKKSELSCNNLSAVKMVENSLQNQLSLAQAHLEQRDPEKASFIYRQILSNKSIPIHADLRVSIERMLQTLKLYGKDKPRADERSFKGHVTYRAESG